MSFFVIEHLPRAAAWYEVSPMSFKQARAWVNQPSLSSAVRTTELISAIEAGMGVALAQSDEAVTLRPGDEALLVTLSFGVLLAWVEGNISPLPEDWRCLLVRVRMPAEEPPEPAVEIAVVEDLLEGEPT
jgi:hypothetical protein